MPVPEWVVASLAFLAPLTHSLPLRLRGSLALEARFPGSVGRPIRDVDLICTAEAFGPVFDALTRYGKAVGAWPSMSERQLETEGHLVGVDITVSWRDAPPSRIPDFDIAVPSHPETAAWLDRLTGDTGVSGVSAIDVPMLIVDKAKLLCPAAHKYASGRRKDLDDLHAISRRTIPTVDEFSVALDGCRQLWKWDDWSGFPQAPPSWAASPQMLMEMSDLFAVIGEAVVAWIQDHPGQRQGLQSD